jgi:hypothetical protein
MSKLPLRATIERVAADQSIERVSQLTVQLAAYLAADQRVVDQLVADRRAALECFVQFVDQRAADQRAAIERYKLKRAHARPKGLLIDLLVPYDRADDILFNLLGRYDHWAEKYGHRWAKVMFTTQSIGVVLSFWLAWVKKYVKVFDFLRPS